MKLTKRILAIAAGLALALPLAACGGDDSGAGGEAGEGGKVVIGIKFDQPGLGLKEGDTYTGFDVEVANYVAKELGYTEVEFKESPSAQRETLIQSDQVKMIFATYSITDDRKQKISFGGPYFIAGQDLLVKADNTDITGPDSLNGKKLCSVTGSTSAKKIKDNYASGVQLQEFDTYSKCVEALERRADRRRDHRQRHLGWFCGAGSVPGQAQGRRQAVLRGAVRRRHQAGRHRAVWQDQHGTGEDGVRWCVGEGPERHRRRFGLQGGHGHQPAQAGRLQLGVPTAGSS